MKSQRQIYEALLRGETLTNANGILVRLPQDHIILCGSNGRWFKGDEPFAFPADWSIAKPEPEIVKFEVDLTSPKAPHPFDELSKTLIAMKLNNKRWSIVATEIQDGE